MQMRRFKMLLALSLAAAMMAASAMIAFADEVDEVTEAPETELTTTVTADGSSIDEETASAEESAVRSEAETSSVSDTKSEISSSQSSSSSASSPGTDTDSHSDTDLIPDYFGDDSYDTSGNASLVREQKIIYDSSEMQFIAVTTKGGNVFYILIDYTAVKDAEDGKEGSNAQGTVYFLNKVDEYDLYSLLYEDSESIPTYSGVDNQLAEQHEAGENVDSESVESTGNDSFLAKNGTLIFMLAAGGIFVAAYYFLKIKPKKSQKTTVEDDYEDELEFADDEINEDYERKPISIQKHYEDSDSGQTEDLSMYGSPDDEDLM